MLVAYIMRSVEEHMLSVYMSMFSMGKYSTEVDEWQHIVSYRVCFCVCVCVLLFIPLLMQLEVCIYS